MRLVAISLLAVGAVQAQTGIHACQAEPAIQKVYSQNRNSPNRVKVLREALASNPDDLFLNRWLILSNDFRPGELAAEYKTRLDAHPGEPLFLYLYGLALAGKDSRRSIRLTEEALAKDPEIPYAYEALIEMSASAGFRDKAKLLENLRAYTARCPQDIDVYSHLRDVDDPQVLREMTLTYRDAIEKHKAIGAVNQYPHLWAAEFRVADPKDYDKVRDRVRTDMARIRELDPSDKNEGKSLSEGYRLLGDSASAAALAAKRVPEKDFNSVFTAWAKSRGGKIDYVELLPASEQWVKDWPNETNALYWRMLAIAHRKDASKEEIEKAGQDVLVSDARTFQGWSSNPYPLAVAEVWAEHDIRLKDCLDLLVQAEKELMGNAQSYDDRRPSMTTPEVTVPMARFRIWITESQVDRKLNDFDAVRAVLDRMKAWTAAHPADMNFKWQGMVWHDESAALAEAEGHRPDAIAHYQLGSQLEQRKARAQALWREMGGTADGFELWWKRPEPPKAPPVASNPAPWTTKEQPLTALNAHDLTGKTWTVAEFKGKRTLINVWATWCEPCRAELPYVQKLFEQTKDRKDIQVITIATDEDPGLLGPFLKAGGYTFPVLLARTLVDDLTAGVSIPRNWIVDGGGVLRAEGIGFSAAEWPEKILGRLEGN